MDPVNDFLLWYSKRPRHQQNVQIKFRKLFTQRILADEAGEGFVFESEQIASSQSIENHDQRKSLVRPDPLTSGGERKNQSVSFAFQGKEYQPPKGSCWKTTARSDSNETPGMVRLAWANRLISKGTLYFKRKYTDFEYKQIENWWGNLGGASNPVYVVQTNQEIVSRCLLMTTDPGDLVFDPTCGSGTTAYVAEQWGRRWITCDTSRVALTLARQRLMTAVFDYYELAHPEEGVGSGFKYKTVSHVTLKSIANNPEIDGIYARMHPAIEQALADLNAALKGQKVRFKVTNGGRAGQFVDFAATDEVTFTMPSGQVVKVNELVEWEVPYTFPEDWPEAARTPFERFHEARRTMQKAMDEAIARHAPQETLYDQPFVDRKKVRVTGPFTVEAVPAPAVKSVDSVLGIVDSEARTSHDSQFTDHFAATAARSGETLRQGEWRDELLRTGIRGKAGQYIRFARLEPLPGCRWLHADGETRPSDEGADSVRETGPAYSPMRVVVSFGPEHAPLEQRQVQRAWEEAQQLVPKPKLLVFAAFQFDPEAAKDIDEMKPELAGMQFLKVQMNADLLTEDLKKKRASNESFWLIGQPDVQVERIAKGENKGKYRVSVHGFDYYNTKTGQIESGGEDRIAVWLLDTDYDGRSLYPRQVFFPMAGENEGWARLAKNLKAEIDEERIEAYRGTVSLPFEPGEHRRIAVKIVDDRGIESLKVTDLPE